MGLIDFLKVLVSPAARASALTGLNEVMRDERPDPHEGVQPVDPSDPMGGHEIVLDPNVRETVPASPPFTGPVDPALPQRFGTFLVVDLYPGDLKGKPNWELLELNSKVGASEVVGAILKATEGQSYAYTPWFVKNGQGLRDLWRGRLGRDRFMGAYHFLQLARDGVKQAEFFVRTMEKIGMPAGGADIRPMLDFEQGGQVNFWPTNCPKDDEGHYDLTKLPDAVKRDLAKRAMETTRTCADRVRELTGFYPMLYGRGLQRDLGMRRDRGYGVRDLHMGCQGVVNPGYTRTMPPMDAYGIQLDEIGLWQYGGDGNAVHPKLPVGVPKFGNTDMNVHINGAEKTSLDSFRKALVCP